ncbi:MAG: ABC transporter ATP-binding protein [Pseudomonadota bacterium]
MSVPILKTEGLRKAYGALKVTDDVSIDLMPGELHAIIGPNGAGKTTLIHQLSGRLAADAGRVLFEGEDVSALSMARRARRGIARTFQITSLLPGFSVLENAALAVQARSGSSFSFFRRAAYERALNDEAMIALETVGIADRADQPASALSHGEQRQLELAVALATKPKLLLLDEPLAGTGQEESADMIELIKGLKGRLPAFLIEHDMDAVFALADRISVLVYGRIIASGPPEAIRADADVRRAYLGEEGMPSPGDNSPEPGLDRPC